MGTVKGVGVVKLLLVTSAQKNSNTDLLNKEFIKIAGEENVEVINAHNIEHCIGCRYCAEKRKCVRHNDALTHFLSMDYSVIVFSGAVFGFTFNSALMAAFHRMLFGLEDKNLGFILCSGSSGYESGIDLIEKNLQRLSQYCNFYYAPLFNKVTYDVRTSVNENDLLGLNKLFKDLKEAYNETFSKKIAKNV